jgi:hypothetical protein
MAETRRRGGFTLGSRGRFPLAWNDLERDLDAGGLVASEPDRARAAAAERLQRAIAAEYELVGGYCKGRF